MLYHKIDVQGRDILDEIAPGDDKFTLRKDISDTSAGKITAKGFNANGEKIENVKNPENPGDAVNLAYLNASGLTDKYYKHTQNEASTSWRIPHNFGRTPNILTKNAFGDVIIGSRADESENIAVVIFSHANSGVADCS